MNIKYVEINGKILVIDENGNLISRENNENLEEILVKENLIEQIKQKISFLNHQTKLEDLSLIEPKKITKRNTQKTFLKYFLGISIASLIVNGVITLIVGPFRFVSHDYLSPMILSAFEIPLLALPFGMTIKKREDYEYQCELKQYQLEEDEYQSLLKEAKVREKQLAFLKDKLATEEEHLKHLVSQEENKENLPLAIKLVDDKKELEMLKCQLCSFHDLEYSKEDMGKTYIKR